MLRFVFSSHKIFWVENDLTKIFNKKNRELLEQKSNEEKFSRIEKFGLKFGESQNFEIGKKTAFE